MHKKRGTTRYLVLIMLAMFAVTTTAQQSVADSLVSRLKKHTRKDTTMVNIMNDIAYAVYNNNSVMAEEYALQSGSLSDELGYKKGKATSC